MQKYTAAIYAGNFCNGEEVPKISHPPPTPAKNNYLFSDL